MTTRIDTRFAELKREGRAAFVTYVMCGDPDIETSLAIIKALPLAGADLIELGMHLDRPPVLPASAPVRFDRIFRSLTSGARHRGGHPHQAPHPEDARDAPSHRNETG